MKLIVERTEALNGEIIIPGSKSHTIRAVIIACLAGKGISIIKNPLKSSDTMASVNACKSLGAEIDIADNSKWLIKGFDGKPGNPGKTLDLANSGTSLRLITGMASLGDFEVTLDGDESLRTRPMQPLLKSLNMLGAEVVSVNNNGNCPIKIKGKIKGGKTEVDGITSQFLSSLLISTPLAEEDIEINVVNIHEVPYIEMTLKWLDEQGIKYEKNDELTHFKIKGNQKYKPFEKQIPGDWSSAAFPLIGAAITRSNVLLKGLDIDDVQGDKSIIEYLERMGADITIEADGIRIKGKELYGTAIDLSNTPDALPALAVVGCFARGATELYNVAQARIKETDRIKVMIEELTKMGAKIKELKDGLIIHNSTLKGTTVEGHSDHRVVMALSLAGLIAEGTTKITTAESVDVTFPGFADSMKNLGAQIEKTVNGIS